MCHKTESPAISGGADRITSPSRLAVSVPLPDLPGSNVLPAEHADIQSASVIHKSQTASALQQILKRNGVYESDAGAKRLIQALERVTDADSPTLKDPRGNPTMAANRIVAAGSEIGFHLAAWRAFAGRLKRR
jgi:hypothetical protein